MANLPVDCHSYSDSDMRFTGEAEAGPSHHDLGRGDQNDRDGSLDEEEKSTFLNSGDEETEASHCDDLVAGMDVDGFSGPSTKIVKPLTAEGLAVFKAAQERTGVIYISRIPPGMRPTKVRHLMSAYGGVGRVYLQPEDPKRAFLRRKYTSTKKVHFTEGWIEFKDKRIARSVAEMLNAQPIGGKKGTRWRDDVWTMKYLPKFKWNMLTEQIAHEAAMHTARLRVELSQSRREQHEYLKNVELARVLDKRAARKRKAGEDVGPMSERLQKTRRSESKGVERGKKPKETTQDDRGQMDNVLGSIF